MALGGKDQKDEGCTLDVHCDQENPELGQFVCHKSTGRCDAYTGPTPPPTPSPTEAPCSGTQERYQVTVTTDNWPSETSYTLTNTCSNEVILEAAFADHPSSHTAYPSETVCADAGAYTFEIIVSQFLCC